MAQDCAEMRVGVTGALYTAPTGTAMPADVSTALGAGWIELGYATEDGLSFSVDTNKEDFNVWQSTSPCRSVITSQIYTATFSLVQRNADTLKLAFGGGTVTLVAAGPTRMYSPPAVGLQEQAFVFEVVDGTIIDRWLIYRGQPALTGDVQFTKSNPTGFEIEVTVLDSVAGRWDLLTNDENVEVDA